MKNSLCIRIYPQKIFLKMFRMKVETSSTEKAFYPTDMV